MPQEAVRLEKRRTSPLGVTAPRYLVIDDFRVSSGARLRPLTLAYETYGVLGPRRDNAILICHALSGDAHAAGVDEETGRLGWWEVMIGPGRPFDTEKYFFVCANVIGGCRGSTGPGSVDPATGKPYGMRFPAITISDMVEAEALLLDHLGIERLLCVTGGSMGGMQVLQWAYSHPERAKTAIAMATTLRHTPQQIAFNEVGRRAIQSDPNWNDGDYYGGEPPSSGLAVARMIGHITYMSDFSMREKFGRRTTNGKGPDEDPEGAFEVENYLRVRGESFVQRFDANSYITITRAIDAFDLGSNRDLVRHFDGCPTKFLVTSYSHDWLYPSYQSREIVRILKFAMTDVTYCEISSTYGHDAFLIENPEQEQLVTHFLANAHQNGRAEPA